MMLICNEGKEDKKYHIAYILNLKSPMIPYCRMQGYLDVAVQVQVDNPKVCETCKQRAGLIDQETTPKPTVSQEALMQAGLQAAAALLPSLPPPPQVALSPLMADYTTDRLHRALTALKDLREAAMKATSEESWWWWQDQIKAACKAAGLDE